MTPSLYRHGHRSKGALPDQPCYTVVDTISQHNNITDTVSKVVHQYRLPPRKAIQPTQEEGASLTLFISRSFFALFHSVRLLREHNLSVGWKKYFIFCNSGQFDTGIKKVYVHYWGNNHIPPARDLQSFCSVHILYNSGTDLLKQTIFALNQSPTWEMFCFIYDIICWYCESLILGETNPILFLWFKRYKKQTKLLLLLHRLKDVGVSEYHSRRCWARWLVQCQAGHMASQLKGWPAQLLTEWYSSSPSPLLNVLTGVERRG